MKRFFINLTEYIKLLFNDIVFQLSGTIGVFAWILGLKYESLASEISWFFIFLAIVISPFRLWINERELKVKKQQKLDEFTKNETDYDFPYQLVKVQLPEDHATVLYSIKSAKEELLDTSASNDEYYDHLKKYIEKLIDLEKLYNHLYKIKLSIENVGFTYDEKINISILPDEGCKFLSQIDIPTKPIKPTFYQPFQNYLSNIPFVAPLNSVADKFRTVHQFNKSLIKVTLRELAIKAEASIIYDGFYIYSPEEKFNLNITISSKSTRVPIEKVISLQTEGIDEISLEESEEE